LTTGFNMPAANACCASRLGLTPDPAHVRSNCSVSDTRTGRAHQLAYRTRPSMQANAMPCATSAHLRSTQRRPLESHCTLCYSSPRPTPRPAETPPRCASPRKTSSARLHDPRISLRRTNARRQPRGLERMVTARSAGWYRCQRDGRVLPIKAATISGRQRPRQAGVLS